MQQFVRVRLVQANSLDLSLFQFDYDLTFAVFFLNADKTIYGRYGTRSQQQDASKDISLAGLRRAMAAALDLHRRFPRNKAALEGKTGPASRYSVPEQYPSLEGKYQARLDYAGRLAQSCIHCHQVRDAERMIYRGGGQPIPDPVLFPWPMPDLIGLSLDPKETAKVVQVANPSPAHQAGFRPGDQLLSLEGQPLISIADVQWVIHNAGSPASLKAQVRRGSQSRTLTLKLPEGWRRRSDISWRTTTWDLRRMATGGLVLEDLPPAERQSAKLLDDDLALRVKYVGQYNEHAAGKRAGFQKDDLIVDLDGRKSRMTESDAIAFLVQNRRPKERVPVTVLRGGQRLTLELPMQ